jgi:hypothetical protein
MTNTQHTPGPWEAQWSTRTNGGPKQGWHVFNRETVDVDGIVCDLPDGNDADANARLIAEAPAMLDALRDATDALEKIVVDEERRARDLHHREAWMPLKFSEARLTKARAAIANNRAILTKFE